MFENLCTLPLSSDIFTQALHPTEPVLAVGLSGGHVQSFRLPSGPGNSDEEDGNTSIISTGTSTIDTEWRTRRHKGSCRTIAFDHDVLYSAGTDGLLKVASSATGQVVSKILLPLDPATDHSDSPTLLHALSPQTLLLATDSSALHIYDLRTPSTFSNSKPVQTHHPHEDYISSLTPLAPTTQSTSGFSKQWVTTGGTTLAVTDLRRGVLVKSEDQEEELLSSLFVSGLPSRPGRSQGEKILVGSGNGVLTLWERGVWDDQDERIIVDGGKGGGESLDALVLMPEGVGDGNKNLCVGVGDGSVRIVRMGLNKVVGEPLRHDEVEAVVTLGFDVEGRLISGGGSIVKVWQEKMNLDKDEGEGEDENSDGDAATAKRALSNESDSDASDDSSDEDQERQRKKKRKRSKGKEKNAGNGILGFKGL